MFLWTHFFWQKCFWPTFFPTKFCLDLYIFHPEFISDQCFRCKTFLEQNLFLQINLIGQKIFASDFFVQKLVKNLIFFGPFFAQNVLWLKFLFRQKILSRKLFRQYFFPLNYCWAITFSLKKALFDQCLGQCYF